MESRLPGHWRSMGWYKRKQNGIKSRRMGARNQCVGQARRAKTIKPTKTTKTTQPMPNKKKRLRLFTGEEITTTVDSTLPTCSAAHSAAPAGVPFPPLSLPVTASAAGSLEPTLYVFRTPSLHYVIQDHAPEREHPRSVRSKISATLSSCCDIANKKTQFCSPYGIAMLLKLASANVPP